MHKIYNGIMGLIVGDALGVPYEFKERDTFKCTEMTGYGTYNQPPGTWSDDSSMTLATLQSLVDNREKIIPEDIMKNFLKWYIFKRFTPHGEVFDIGNTTRNALVRFFHNEPIESCGGKKITDNGNGSLMRILPLAYVECTDEEIANVSALTHAHPISVTACIIYITIAKNLLNGVSLEKAIEYGHKYTDLKQFDRLHNLKELSRDEIKSTGYVVDTLEAALWCLLNTDNYKECVLTAVNLGNDTDTVAAVAGGLAGIIYGVGGEKGIPEEWIRQLAGKTHIEDLCKRLEIIKAQAKKGA